MMILDLCAGPGGMDQGARILGIDGIRGYDFDRDACATASAAGFDREQADVRTLRPDQFPEVTGAIITPPCPTFSAAGKRSGIADYQLILDTITHAGGAQQQWDDEVGGFVPGCGCTWEQIAPELDACQDPRSGLAALPIAFALGLPALEWLVLEQVPALAPMWEDIAAELYAAGWESVDVGTVEAADYGLASRRRRAILVAHRYRPVGSFGPCGLGLPAVTMSSAIGWPVGEHVNTRGARKTSGGNNFPADKTSWCLTEKARSWKRISDGEQLTPSQAGLLTGFPADYPWQGSRSKQFLQAADVVSPLVAAAVLGAALGIDWQPAVRTYVGKLYPDARQPNASHQMSLFGEAT